MQVRGDDQGPAFAGGVAEPVAGLGGGLPGAEHADVIDRDEVAPGDLGDGLGCDAVGGGAAADFFFEQDADDLGGVSPPGSGGGEDFGRGFAQVGQAHPAQLADLPFQRVVRRRPSQGYQRNAR